jgi:hypothetical protein
MALVEFNETFNAGGEPSPFWHETLKYIIPFFTALFAFWLGRRGAKSKEEEIEKKTYDAFIDEVMEIRSELVLQIKDLHRWIGTLDSVERDNLATPLTNRLSYVQSLDRKLVTAFVIRTKSEKFKKEIRARYNALAVLDNQSKLLTETVSNYEEKIQLTEANFVIELKKLNDNLVAQWGGDDKNLDAIGRSIAQVILEKIMKPMLKDARTLRPILQELLLICDKESANAFALSTAKILSGVFDRLGEVEITHQIFKVKFQNNLDTIVLCFLSIYPDSTDMLMPTKASKHSDTSNL